MIEPRNYARPEQFELGMRNVEPTIDDVAPPSSLYGKLGTILAWNQLPARVIVAALAYIAFPPLITYLESVGVTQNVENSKLTELVNSFLPGISVVLGTYFSLTLGILYDRLTLVQENATREASILAYTFSNLMHLFAKDAQAKRSGAQCVADQINSLIHESRGREAMRVMYSDPYERILRLIHLRYHQGDGKLNNDVS